MPILSQNLYAFLRLLNGAESGGDGSGLAGDRSPHGGGRVQRGKGAERTTRQVATRVGSAWLVSRAVRTL